MRRDGKPVGLIDAEHSIQQAEMRAHRLILFVVSLFVALAGVSAAMTSLARPTLTAASQSAPPVAPLLFGSD